MLTKLLNKESKTKCPRCNKNLPYNCLTPYIIKGPIYEINCPHCNAWLRPIKHPVPFWTGVAIGFWTVQLTTYVYWRFIEMNFLKGAGFSILVFIPIFIGICYYTIKKIQFTES